MQILPLETTINQEFQITLGGQDCTIAIYQRGQAMYLDLAVGENWLRRGMICQPCVGMPESTAGFKGQIFVIDTLSAPSKQAAPQWDGLNSRWQFVYLTDTELAEIKSQPGAASGVING